MNKDDILKSVYEDFFGIGKIEKQNEKLREEIKNLKGINEDEGNIPYIEIQKNNEENDSNIQLTEEQKDNKMKEIFSKIDELYIEETSKETLKKIVEYIRKYSEKIENQFISFNMCVYLNNKETFEELLKILNVAVTFFGYFPKGDIGIISMYDLQNTSDIEKIYTSDNSIIAFQNMKALDAKDMAEKEKILHKLNENIKEKERNILTIFHAKSKDELSDLFLTSNELKNEFSTFEINGRKPEVQEVYQEVMDKLKNNDEISEESQIKLLDYISNTYPKTELSYPEYRDDLIQKVSFNKQVPEYEQDKSIEEIFEELDSLVGLEKVKKMLRELVDLIELKEKSKNILNIKSVNLHMVFLGNPGTGKTTVARIVSKILYNLKYIKQDKLIEATSKDLVAEYVGQTAVKTMNIINKALRRSIIYR